MKDSRLKRLGRRLIAFQSDQAINSYEKGQIVEYLHEKWNLDSKESLGWATFEQVEKDLAEIRSKGMLAKQELEELENFYDSIRRSINLGEIPFN